MNEVAEAIKRAKEAIKSAEAVTSISLPTAASRIYRPAKNTARSDNQYHTKTRR